MPLSGLVVLYGLRKLQRAQNAAARLLTSCKKYDHITRDGGAGGAGGALAPPLLRRMTFYFVLVYVVIRENT